MIQILDGATASVDGLVVVFSSGNLGPKKPITSIWKVGDRVRPVKKDPYSNIGPSWIGTVTRLREKVSDFEGNVLVQFDGEYQGFQWFRDDDLKRA